MASLTNNGEYSARSLTLRDRSGVQGTHEVDSGAICGQLEKLMSSPEFRAADRMRRFLSFAVSEMLAGRGEHLKEYTIAVHVFDRPETFDPATDPIVRVEARRLREKLNRYYQGRGRGDELIIEIPTGAYVPRFVRRRDLAAFRTVTETVTVRPFVALSASAEPIGEGLLYELVHELVRFHGISVSTGAGTGREQGSGLIVTGCIHALAERVRVIAHVLDAHSGQCHWSAKIEYVMSSTVHEALAPAIAQGLVDHLRRAPLDMFKKHSVSLA